ncbi:MAG: hypothetical protein ABIJ82_03045 [Patescibacteria group bacterium]|nr:hypothetical protein [Patescibacteria group bacterium]MBU1953150.1 hypothetical protein [Patescibacteria group bacterium]
MILKVSKLDDQKIEQLCLKGLSEVESFFDVKKPYNEPKFCLIDDRECIDYAYGTKTEAWVVGWGNGKYIFLLNPNNYEKESNHKYTDDEYSRLIKHEVIHYFYKSLTATDNPRWLTEGLSIYLSNQLARYKQRPTKFTTFLDYYDKTDAKIYKEAGFVIGCLINKFGKDKLLVFIRKLRGNKNSEDVDKIFTEIFGVELSYTEINKLL